MDRANRHHVCRKYGEHAINRLTAARAGLNQDDRVLDIGCGSGSVLRAAAEFATKGDLIGVDPTPAMIRISQTESADHPDFARMRLLLGGAEALPLPDNRVTVCWAIKHCTIGRILRWAWQKLIGV
ncbi:class I SAM-dependent methyltransferase [Kiloniella antarctica]|uniref:Class I SAM-dependent methyltransferase n=1 Tax=Kiloniella antarctica TaxID=1550907 RepID=A0ABW5BI42_9PROT